MRKSATAWFIFLLSVSIFSNEDYFTINKDLYNFQKDGYSTSFPTTNIKYTFKKEIPNNHFKIFTYISGLDGTSILIQTTSAMIFNKKSKAYLGSYPYHYESQSENTKTKDLTQPVWTIKEKSIEIFDEETFLKKTITLEK